MSDQNLLPESALYQMARKAAERAAKSAVDKEREDLFNEYLPNSDDEDNDFKGLSLSSSSSSSSNPLSLLPPDSSSSNPFSHSFDHLSSSSPSFFTPLSSSSSSASPSFFDPLSSSSSSPYSSSSSSSPSPSHFENTREKPVSMNLSNDVKQIYINAKLRVSKRPNQYISGPDAYELNDKNEPIMKKPIFDRLTNKELQRFKHKNDEDVYIKDKERPNFKLNGDDRRQYFKYNNRHIVVPQDIVPGYYYKIDKRAKGKKIRGKWVEILSSKWATKQNRYTWVCKEVGGNEMINTVYIDGLSGIPSEDKVVQQDYKKKYAKKELCMTMEQQKLFISKLREMIKMFVSPSSVGKSVTRQIGPHSEQYMGNSGRK